MGFQPINGRLLVQRTKASETTEGGLYIPQKSQERLDRGTVLARADDVTEVSVGDVVLWAPYVETTIRAGDLGEGCVVLDVADILGVYEA